MATFPANPIEGQLLVVNGINYVYNSGSNAWTRQPLGNINAYTYQYATGEYVAATYILDDISYKFDSSTKSFTLSYNNGTTIAPNTPQQLTIVIGNNNVWPAFYIADYQNLPEVSLFDQGFILSGSTITFATAPLRGMSFYGTVRTNQDVLPAFSYKTTPFRALNIMLGA